MIVMYCPIVIGHMMKDFLSGCKYTKFIDKTIQQKWHNSTLQQKLNYNFL